MGRFAQISSQTRRSTKLSYTPDYRPSAPYYAPCRGRGKKFRPAPGLAHRREQTSVRRATIPPPQRACLVERPAR